MLFLSKERPGWLRYGFFYGLLMVCLMLLGVRTWADDLPVFRIGVIDNEASSFVQGITLAVNQINDGGGVIGADGTAFALEIILQSPDDMVTALANMNQARVIAVLGPVASSDVLGHLSGLQALNVPILTPARDDSILVLDATNRVFRTRSQEVLLARALADYVVNELGIRRIGTVQLDLESTGGVFGLVNALQSAGVTPVGTFLLDDADGISSLIDTIIGASPEALAVYGVPRLASSLYLQLRDGGWQGRFIYNQVDEDDFRDGLDSGMLEGILVADSWHASADDDASVRFLIDYVATFDDVPSSLSATGYDAVRLLAEAIERPGDLLGNLQSLQNLEGVQGLLLPSGLPVGEMSNNSMLALLNRFGGRDVVARYLGITRIDTSVSPLATLPTATPAPSATPDGVIVTITRAVQNVRTGPGLEYDILGQLREGEQAEVIGATSDNSWVVINFRGQEGWLSRGILDVFGDLNRVAIISAPPTPTPLPTATGTPFADITIVSATPSRLTVGQPFNVSVIVRNQGNLPAGAFAVAATFEPGGAYTAVNLPSLAANSDVTITLTGTLGIGATGVQNVTIVGDLNQQLDEGPNGKNNNNLLFNYIADAPMMSSGLIQVNDGFGTSLDGGVGNDLLWSGGVLSGVGATLFIPMSGFSGLETVHRDAIPTPTTVALSGVQIQPGAIIGFITDGGAKTGVLQIVTSPSGGQLQFNVRVYN